MIVEEFIALRALQDRRVRMIFTDGQEIIATLDSVTTDFDGSQHLTYRKVESSTLHSTDAESTFYAAGEDLVSCSELS
jgi:hypothetical protein